MDSIVELKHCRRIQALAKAVSENKAQEGQNALLGSDEQTAEVGNPQASHQGM